MARVEGFEPPIMGPEPIALPLGYTLLNKLTVVAFSIAIRIKDSKGPGHVPRPRNFTIASTACIGRFPCDPPLAALTPCLPLGYTLTQDISYLRVFER